MNFSPIIHYPQESYSIIDIEILSSLFPPFPRVVVFPFFRDKIWGKAIFRRGGEKNWNEVDPRVFDVIYLPPWFDFIVI